MQRLVKDFDDRLTRVQKVTSWTIRMRVGREKLSPT